MKLENKSRMEKYGEIRQNKKKELDVKKNFFKLRNAKDKKKKNDENGEEIQNAFKLKSMRKGGAR